MTALAAAPGRHAGVGVAAWCASSTSSASSRTSRYRGVRLTDARHAARARDGPPPPAAGDSTSPSRSACRGTACTHEAEVLEHVLSEELEALIAAKLGNPTHDPHGDPIPSADLVIGRGAHARACRRSSRATRPRSCASRTPSRRCCATSPRAGSSPARACASSTSSRSAARCSSSVGDETHALGGQLADLDAGARREPAAR